MVETLGMMVPKSSARCPSYSTGIRAKETDVGVEVDNGLVTLTGR